MDLHQIEYYIVAIAQEQNIAKAANRLFLTQSALNQQLLRLEKELGVPLFERKNRLMIPTYAGRVYLEAAEKIINIRDKTHKILQNLKDENAGEISIAFTPEVGSRMFSAVYPKFHEQYPNVSFCIHEARIKEMEQLLLRREAMLAVLSYFDFSRNPELAYIDMDEEFMVLGLPASHPLATLAGENSHETLPLLDLRLLKDEKFVMLGKETRMRDLADLAFAYAGFQPKVLFESSSTQTLLDMVCAQVAPAFFPQSYVRAEYPVVYFRVAPIKKWVRSIGFLNGTYLTKPEKYLTALLVDYVHGQLLATKNRQAQKSEPAVAPDLSKCIRN